MSDAALMKPPLLTGILLAVALFLSGCTAGSDGATGLYVSPVNRHLIAIIYTCNDPATGAGVTGVRARGMPARWTVSLDTTEQPLEIDLTDGSATGATLEYGELPLPADRAFEVSGWTGAYANADGPYFRLREVMDLPPGLIVTGRALGNGAPRLMTRDQFLWRTCRG